MVRSLVFAFPVVPRNYTWFDAANNRGLWPLERPLISLSGPSAKSPTHLGARRGLCVLTIRSRSYRIPLLVSACYPNVGSSSFDALSDVVSLFTVGQGEQDKERPEENE